MVQSWGQLGKGWGGVGGVALAGLEMERIKKTHVGVAEESNQEGA